MRIELRSRTARNGGEVRAELERRIRFALGRFQNRIRAVTVRLTDANGPRGGVDQECRISVDAGDRSPIVILERHHDPRAAVALAADRAARAVARHIRLHAAVR